MWLLLRFLVLAALIALFEYQLQISELDELEQIQYVNPSGRKWISIPPW